MEKVAIVKENLLAGQAFKFRRPIIQIAICAALSARLVDSTLSGGQYNCLQEHNCSIFNQSVIDINALTILPSFNIHICNSCMSSHNDVG